MSDVLIRDVPDEVLSAIDAHASELGLSRSEYLRRRLGQDARRSGGPVGVADLQQFGEHFADLADSHLMTRAWS